MTEPSAAYRRAVAEAAKHHASSKTYSGKFLRPHKPFLTALIERLGIASALDYGAGKGEQYLWRDPVDGKTLEEVWGFEVAKFDPAWPPFAAEPEGRFDLVLCTHVLGSIPLTDLDWVLGRIFGAADKAVMIAEKLGPVKKKALSDPHLRPVGWDEARWIRAIGPFAERFAGETHVSFRIRDEVLGVQTIRHRYSNGRWTMLRVEA